MSRCRACDAPLSPFELRLKKEDGSPEDICVSCKVYIREAIDGIHMGHIPFKHVSDSFIDYDDTQKLFSAIELT